MIVDMRWLYWYYCGQHDEKPKPKRNKRNEKNS